MSGFRISKSEWGSSAFSDSQDENKKSLRMFPGCFAAIEISVCVLIFP